METLAIPQDIPVFGCQVINFPAGVGEAFGALAKKVPGAFQRACYGISSMAADGSIIYYAALQETFPGEAQRYGYNNYTIPKGDYLAETLLHWRDNLHCIKDVFHVLMQDPRFDNQSPCVEWYKSDEEMICMLRADPVKLLMSDIAVSATTLINLLSPLDQQQINTTPFEGSWSAAQLATHITKSNNGIAQAMEMAAVPAERDPVARAHEIKTMFLNFETKFTSPPFIDPPQKEYKKEEMMKSLDKSNIALVTNASRANMESIITLPALGEITKMELLHFVLYHTQRHIHQLKAILRHV